MNTYICKASKHPGIQRHFQFLYSSHVQLDFCSKWPQISWGFLLEERATQGERLCPSTHDCLKGLSSSVRGGTQRPWFPSGFLKAQAWFYQITPSSELMHIPCSCTCQYELSRDILGWLEQTLRLCVQMVPCRGRQLWEGPVLIWQGCHWPWSANPEQCSRMAAQSCWAPAGTKPMMLQSAVWEAFAIPAY